MTKQEHEITAEEKTRQIASKRLEHALDAAYLAYHLFEDVIKETEPMMTEKEKEMAKKIGQEHFRNVTLGIGLLQTYLAIDN